MKGLRKTSKHQEEEEIDFEYSLRYSKIIGREWSGEGTNQWRTKKRGQALCCMIYLIHLTKKNGKFGGGGLPYHRRASYRQLGVFRRNFGGNNPLHSLRAQGVVLPDSPGIIGLVSLPWMNACMLDGLHVCLFVAAFKLIFPPCKCVLSRRPWSLPHAAVVVLLVPAIMLIDVALCVFGVVSIPTCCCVWSAFVCSMIKYTGYIYIIMLIWILDVDHGWCSYLSITWYSRGTYCVSCSCRTGGPVDKNYASHWNETEKNWNLTYY